MTHANRTIRRLAALLFALLFPLATMAQPAKPAPKAKSNQAAYTPEAAASLAIYAWNEGRRDGMLQTENKCWNVATEQAGVRAAGIFCAMVSISNRWVQQAQRQMDGMASLPDFEKMPSFERFAMHAVVHGMSPQELQMAMKFAERERDRLKIAMRSQGLSVIGLD